MGRTSRLWFVQGTAYAYLYNLQGDVIALVDANGSKVVEYKYDA